MVHLLAALDIKRRVHEKDAFSDWQERIAELENDETRRVADLRAEPYLRLRLPRSEAKADVLAGTRRRAPAIQQSPTAAALARQAVIIIVMTVMMTR